jgi:hypothetical protein
MTTIFKQLTKHARLNTTLKATTFRQIFSCTQLLRQSFEKINYFHVLWDLNYEEDKRENEVVGLREGN